MITDKQFLETHKDEIIWGIKTMLANQEKYEKLTPSEKEEYLRKVTFDFPSMNETPVLTPEELETRREYLKQFGRSCDETGKSYTEFPALTPVQSDADTNNSMGLSFALNAIYNKDAV
jgi:uncharacterized protein YnzC (UPF0291/DUF896 family)